jgi:hypothetical protein
LQISTIFVTKGVLPKSLRIGKELDEEEVEALFGPCNCNGYRYYHYLGIAIVMMRL